MNGTNDEIMYTHNTNVHEREKNVQRYLLNSDHSDKFFRFKETLQMSHLPETHANEDFKLRNWPPKHTLVSALTGSSKSFFTVLQRGITNFRLLSNSDDNYIYGKTYPLVVLFLHDLINLVQKLSDAYL